MIMLMQTSSLPPAPWCFVLSTPDIRLGSMLTNGGDGAHATWNREFRAFDDPVVSRIGALLNFCLRIAYILGIKPIADARDGLLPVPSHQLFPSGGFDLHTSRASVFRWPYFLKP